MKTGTLPDFRSPELQAASREKARSNTRLRRAVAELSRAENPSRAVRKILWEAVVDAQSAHKAACASFNHLKKIDAERRAPRSVPSAITGEPIFLQIG